MGNESIIFQNVSYTYETATSPLIVDLSAHFPRGWTGIVGPNGAGKTTILKLATGELSPQQGHVRYSGRTIYCPQRTDDIPPDFADLLCADDEDAHKTKQVLGIDDDWLNRWETLSHGERKRAQVAVVLWSRPQVLAVDEPTNHLDAGARDLLADALRLFPGAGLLVSHDRELLDSLCRQCLFVQPPGAIMRPGGYTQGFLQTAAEDEHARKRYAQAKSVTKKLGREAARRRNLASQADKKLSKRGLSVKDHDARDKIDRARLSGKDGVDGKRLRQVEGRLKQARKKKDAVKVRKTYETGIWLEGARSKRDTLFNIPEGSIAVGQDRTLRFFPLIMRPDDRIALTGPNGTGKSTLVSHIVKCLSLPADRVTYLPQEIDLHASKDVINRCRRLPKDVLGHVMTVVSRLGSRPQRLLESAEPSPGEIRKILLAIGIAQAANLIIMDEPTNHLDLPSIECLEDALRDCPCGLLLVSHDRRFLSGLTNKTWHLLPCVDDGQTIYLTAL